ncbi:MAG: hypothetical protein FWG63_11650 [Defluviitaleaceae bacterium]|nr:hypothetical protein [Defluviitaleaceae bacterium]
MKEFKKFSTWTVINKNGTAISPEFDLRLSAEKFAATCSPGYKILEIKYLRYVPESNKVYGEYEYDGKDYEWVRDYEWVEPKLNKLNK